MYVIGEMKQQPQPQPKQQRNIFNEIFSYLARKKEKLS